MVLDDIDWNVVSRVRVLLWGLQVLGWLLLLQLAPLLRRPYDGLS